MHYKYTSSSYHDKNDFSDQKIKGNFERRLELNLMKDTIVLYK